MDGRVFDGLFTFLIIIGLAIGIIVGGMLFEVIPWLYHHLSFSWK